MNKKSKSTLEKMNKIMSVRNYSPQTVKSYLGYTNKFLSFFNKDAYHISVIEARNYLLNYSYTSVSQQNQIINAVKLFYREVIGRNISINKIKRPRKEKRLPRVINQYVLIDKLSKIENLKHKALLVFTFSCGLRISETINMKIKDIDSGNMLVAIRQSKGKKDRYSPLTQLTLELLREYFLKYKPKEYLFNGQNSQKYSYTSCNKIFKKYIDPDCSTHTLRHSAGTAAYENGTDLRSIQKWFGHNSSKTTEIYTHISVKELHKIKQAI